MDCYIGHYTIIVVALGSARDAFMKEWVYTYLPPVSNAIAELAEVWQCSLDLRCLGQQCAVGAASSKTVTCRENGGQLG